jgi:diguanylate cyclase (GGDEF)-like protein
MTTVDAVTGLLDRNSLNENFEIAFAKAVKESEPLGIVFADIDRFKKVNDTYGHQKGDAVLAGVALRLRKVTAGKGIVYRFGGEEMVMLLPNNELQESASVAERCRRALESSPIADIKVTASFGVSSYPETANSIDTLLEAADKAMYDAKTRGRNLVRLFGEPEPSAANVQPTVRRQPDPGHLSDEHKEALRRDYFRTGRAVCPMDQAILQVHKSHAVGEATPRLLIMCPLCGLNEVI